MNRYALMLMSSLALGGCAGSSDGTLGYVGGSAAVSTIGTVQGRALAILPAEAGPVIAVNEKRNLNAITQNIVLGGSQVNDGENAIVVKALMPYLPGQGNAETEIKVTSPSETEVYEEMTARFPSIQMHISTVAEHNAQGPFGYATGVGPAGSTCLYAWQFIGPDHLSLLDGATGRAQDPISVRVRLCKPGGSRDHLIALVRQMIVFAPGGGATAPAPMASAPLVQGDTLAAASASTYVPLSTPGFAPRPAYAAAPTYAQPAYAAPQPAYAAAAPVYAAPAQVYAAPAQVYAAPAQVYAAPAPVYAAPAPAPFYAAPAVYAAPQPAYAAPVYAPALAAAEPADDEAVVAPRVRHAAPRRAVRREVAQRRRPARTYVRRERQQPQPEQMIGNAIPMPGEVAVPTRTASAPPPLAARATAAPAAPVAVPDNVPLPR